jgi:hypothetical protein
MGYVRHTMAEVVDVKLSGDKMPVVVVVDWIVRDHLRCRFVANAVCARCWVDRF